jgi:Tol biopolymer transport system component
VQRNTDIWLIDEARTTRFTFDPNIDRYPRWSPDGSRLVFSRLGTTGIYDLYQKPSNGAGAEALLLESPQTKVAASWSSDGRFLLYIALFPKTSFDLWVLPMVGDPKPFTFLNSTFIEGRADYSPDGRWIAYLSNESGRNEVYVRPFPGPGGQWQVSTAGGDSPRWRADGKELYYIAPDSKLMAVPIVVKGAAIEPGLPTALFQTRISLGQGGARNLQQYDVAPDGRFLINVTTDDGVTTPITVIQNWTPKN